MGEEGASFFFFGGGGGSTASQDIYVYEYVFLNVVVIFGTVHLEQSIDIRNIRTVI